jgi:thermostable 8-oxoguanine DNA glycosylase
MNYLIDPEDVINYTRTDAELELWWLFSCVVAGKTARTQAKLLDSMLNKLEGETPFEKFRKMSYNQLRDALIESRIGQYNRLIKTFWQSLDVDLRNASVEELEAIHGVGPKTARMFIMMSRPGARYAALDTHVLKHLRANGIDAPKATPPAGKRYRELEEAFIALADKAGETVADYDLAVWKDYSRKEAA